MLNVHESSFKDPSPHGSTAPSSILLLLSGITRFSSISSNVPRPSHVSHFPKGELNENIRGASSPILMPHSGHAKFSLKSMSSLPITLTITSPSAIFNAVSIESASLLLISFFITILSTTASIVCLTFFLSFISSSSISNVSPSILALTKPFFLMSSSTFTCSPFLPLIMGASICIFVFSGRLIILSTITSTV